MLMNVLNVTHLVPLYHLLDNRKFFVLVSFLFVLNKFFNLRCFQTLFFFSKTQSVKRIIAAWQRRRQFTIARAATTSISNHSLCFIYQLSIHRVLSEQNIIAAYVNAQREKEAATSTAGRTTSHHR